MGRDTDSLDSAKAPANAPDHGGPRTLAGSDMAGSDELGHGGTTGMNYAPVTDQRPVSLTGWAGAALAGLACWVVAFKLLGF